MKVLIVLQKYNGGTNFLLNRLYVWLNKNGHFSVISNTNNDVIGKWDLVILPTSELNRIYGLKHVSKYVVWSMGHGALQAAFYSQNINVHGWRHKIYQLIEIWLKYRAQATVRFLLQSNAVFFTDEVGMNADIAFLQGKEKDKFKNLVVPIAIDAYAFQDYLPTDKYIIDNVLSIGWLGRLDADFKIHSLLRVLSDLKRAQINKEIVCKLRLVVIGNGNSLGLLQTAVKEFGDIDFVYHEHISADILPLFIRENVDIMFAMGTSSLDAAKATVPTVVVQPLRSYDNPSSAIYRWIYHSNGYSLGEFLGETLEPKQVSCTMHKILADYFSNAKHIAMECRIYSEQYFDENVFPVFVEKLENNGAKKSQSILIAEWKLLYEFKRTVKFCISKLWHRI